MRTTQSMLALAAAATSALTGLGVAAPAAATGSTTTHEVGNVLECGGTVRGRSAYVSLYENSRHPAVMQVLIGQDGHQVGGSREVRGGFVHRGDVAARMLVGRHRAVVEGTATRSRHRTPVHEEQVDAGQDIVVDGFHRRLDTDLTLTWRHRTVPLACDDAFFYDLRVTRTDVTG